MYLNPSARNWRSQYEIDPAVLELHSRLPNYAVTPLINFPKAVCQGFDLDHIYLKDESSRFSMPAFKILGASWASYHTVVATLSLPSTADFETIRNAAREQNVTLYAATDGNFGRAVAQMATLMGLDAVIYVPKIMTEETKQLIASEGARVVVIQGNYDAAVQAAEQGSKSPEGGGLGLLIQDNAWPGYEEIPRRVAEGYSTMMVEIDEQIQAAVGKKTPDLVVIPVGVGSLAHAVVTHFKSKNHHDPPPFLLTVEPETAACLRQSLEKGEMVTVDTGETMMCGMCCGTVSSIAWPELRDGVDASLTVSEAEAEAALTSLNGNGIVTGPCSAGTLAGLLKFLETRGDYSTTVALPKNPVIVLLGTEGPRDRT